VDAPIDEDAEHRRIRKAKNAKRAKCKRNAKARARHPPHCRNLQGAFAAADDCEYNTPIGNIVEAALLIQQLPQNAETQRLMQLTQHAIIQLDQRDPMPSA
jgi:hypothetical protein